MKLREITKKPNKKIRTLRKPTPQNTEIYNPQNGNDAGARNTGSNSYTTGVPTKARHRKFFGI